MSARGRFWLALTLLLVAFCALGYWQTDWVEKEVDVGYADEAAINDFLAAEIFLKELGLEVETVTGMTLLDALPSTDHMLFLSASRESLSARRREALASWVAAGGELLVVARSVYDRELERSDDALLDELGVFLLGPDDETDDTDDDPDDETSGDVEEGAEYGAEHEAEEESGRRTSPQTVEPSTHAEASVDPISAPAEDADSDSSTGAPPRTLDELLTAGRDEQTCREVGEGLDELSIEKRGTISLELSGANELAVNEEDLDKAYFSKQDQVLSLPVGEGRVIAVTSAAPFANQRIVCHDHAFFLWFVARNSSKLWLLHDPDVPSLSELLWREFPASAAGGLLLIVLFVASHSMRFGIADTPDETPRRELREHLEASVTFQFRKGDFDALFEGLRADLIRRGPRDAERWAERAGVSTQEARQVLVEALPRRRREILKRMRTMLRMRRTR